MKPRPDHPDFWLMCAAVNDLDNASDQGVAFGDIIGDIDLDSLSYMAMQRELRVEKILGDPVPSGVRIMACWVDAFMAGMRFQQLRDKQEAQK